MAKQIKIGNSTILTEPAIMKILADNLYKIKELIMENPVINVLPVRPGNAFHSKCTIQGKKIKGCKSKPVFMIFGDDGKTKTSRLEGSCCANHLPLAIRRVAKSQGKY